MRSAQKDVSRRFKAREVDSRTSRNWCNIANSLRCATDQHSLRYQLTTAMLMRSQNPFSYLMRARSSLLSLTMLNISQLWMIISTILTSTKNRILKCHQSLHTAFTPLWNPSQVPKQNKDNLWINERLHWTKESYCSWFWVKGKCYASSTERPKSSLMVSNKHNEPTINEHPKTYEQSSTWSQKSTSASLRKPENPLWWFKISRRDSVATSRM